MNGTSVMTALACIAYKRAEYLAQLSTKITAMVSVGMQGNDFHFDEALFAVKPHPINNKLQRGYATTFKQNAHLATVTVCKIVTHCVVLHTLSVSFKTPYLGFAK